LNNLSQSDLDLNRALPKYKSKWSVTAMPTCSMLRSSVVISLNEELGVMWKKAVVSVTSSNSLMYVHSVTLFQLAYLYLLSLRAYI
jgi:hypothetical protein